MLFTYRPTYGASLNKKPRTTEAKFGDGYRQIARNGINNDPEEWDLSWDKIDNATADAIADFLDARGGAEPFEWKNPRGLVKRFTCAEHSRTYTEPGYSSIKAKFSQFFG